MDAIVYILIGLGALLAAFIAVIAIRTASFKPEMLEKPEESPVEFDTDAAVEALRALIRCRTVSNSDPDFEDDSEFEKLINLLPTLYPEVYRVCELTKMADRGLLFRWRGRTDGAPTVLMAHYDVVVVNENDWAEPPFEGVLKDGVLWGRGTLDTKVTFNSTLFAANTLIKEGYTPECDIYFAFSGNEEVNGRGAVNIVDYFEKEGITPALVLDEGGAVVENVFPGVKAPCALVGIAEKGMLEIEYKVKSQGGHASAPKPNSPIPALSRACLDVETHPFKKHMTKPVALMFDTLGRHSTLLYRIIFANLWCFSGLLDILCRATGGELNAMMRTTVAFTQAEASKQSNVIPPSASLVTNMRLNPMDTMESAMEYVRKTVKNKNVTLTKLRGMNPSRISDTDTDGYRRVEKAIRQTWDGSIVSPYLMVQCSDSRHWGRISDRVYRFSTMDLTTEERATIHGNNERIRVDCLERSVSFYIRLMKQC